MKTLLRIAAAFTVMAGLMAGAYLAAGAMKISDGETCLMVLAAFMAGIWTGPMVADRLVGKAQAVPK